MSAIIQMPVRGETGPPAPCAPIGAQTRLSLGVNRLVTRIVNHFLVPRDWVEAQVLDAIAIALKDFRGSGISIDDVLDAVTTARGRQ